MKKIFLPILFILLCQSVFSQSYEHGGDYMNFPPNVAENATTYLANKKIYIGPGANINGSTTQSKFYIGVPWVEGASYNPVFNGAYNQRVSTGLNTECEVGTIAGGGGVSPTGAATYSIPIQVPPGTAGMMPSLSVNYNSQGGNGLLGMGWSLGGISAITRVGSTPYHDGKIRSVQYDTGDNFAWDGQRLISIGNGQYRTEIESFAEITAEGSFGSGPANFIVKTKDGKTLYYGRGQWFSRLYAGNEIQTWYLTRVEDHLGNYMVYNYEQQSWDEVFLQSIEYTGNRNAGLSPYNKIEFLYRDRNDTQTSYRKGNRFENSLLLRDIITYSNGGAVKRYFFQYCYDQYSKLEKITEYDGGGNHYNSTVVKWGEEGDDFSTSSAASLRVDENYDETDNYDIFFGDFNGDGKSDALRAFKQGEDVYLRLDVMFSDGSNFNYENWKTFTKANSVEGIITTDVDGDGYDEIITKNISCTAPGTTQYNIYKVHQTDYTLYHSGNMIICDGIVTAEFFGDIDGDGILELYALSSITIDCSFWRGEMKKKNIYDNNEQLVPAFMCHGIYRIDGTELDLFSSIENLDLSDLGYRDVKSGLIDFNGDGRMDIILRSYDSEDNTVQYIFGYNKDNKFDILKKGGMPTYTHDAFYSDFNGDGISDVLTFHPDAGWEIGFGTGKEWVKNNVVQVPTNLPHCNHISDPFRRLIVTDLNGDGKDDMLFYYSREDDDGPSYVQMDVYYSNGRSFNQVTRRFDDWKADFNGRSAMKGPFDMNGDGKLEVIYHTGPNNNNSIVYFQKGLLYHESNLVESIRNGLNHLITFNYNTLSASENYTRDNSDLSNSSIRHLNIPIWVVRYMKEDYGKDVDFNTTEYSYTGAKFHKEGKGFLGFDKVVVEYDFPSVTTTTEYEINTDYFISRPVKTSTQATTSTTVTSSNKYLSCGGKRVFPYTDKITSTNSLNGTTTVDYTYNLNSSSSGFGTLASEVTDYGSEYKTTKTYTYDQYAGINRVIVSTLQKERPEGSKTWTTTNTYDEAKACLVKTTDNNGVETSYTYDNCGNPTSTTVSANGLVSRTSSVEYDNTYRWPVKKTNALGHSSSYTYHSKLGTLISETDPNGLVTQYEYNDFGRLTRTIPPVGSPIETSLSWETSDKAENSLYCSITTSAGAPDAREYYDKLGRSVLRQTTDFSGNNVYTATTYHRNGEVHYIYEPFGDSDDELNKKLNSYSYDNDLRLFSTINPVNCTTYFDYSTANQTKVSSCNGQSKTTQNNPDGSTAWITDNGGTIDYNYNEAGQVTEIKVTPAGMATSTTKIEYDMYGNQKSLNDPNAGAMQYNYNAFGELLSQTNNKGQTTSYTYDILGRVKTENGPDLSNTYLYDTKFKGALTSVTGSNTSTRYTYDSYGRVSNTTKEYNGNSYTFAYTYNTNGQLENYTYPSGYTTKNKYNSLGYLNKVQQTVGANTLDLWTCTSINQYGMVSSATLGNGYIQQRGYDNGKPELLKVIYSDNNNVALNQGYLFNQQTGNLEERTDEIRSLTETFSYDGMNRLTEIHHGTDVFSTGYDANGNITSKYDAGHSYNYMADTRPHAVNTVESDILTISDVPQNIEYNSFEQPYLLTQGGKQLDITYDGITQQRIRSVYTNADNTSENWERTYLGDYEIVKTGGQTYHLHYISGSDGLCAIHVKTEGAGEATYYVTTDYLGNIVLITDQERNTVQEYSYDAWGRRRDPSNWDNYNITPNPLAYRGYTGHEHLEEFGLINMNGRMYDPILGRMLSPDNYVQSASSTQSFNRYAYCLNNPLIYTDPSGEFITWSISNGGFSIGFNLTPIGIPLGAGINVGWADGASLGGYGEVGYRVGGTGFGSGVTVSQSLDYNFKHNGWSTTTSEGAYASFGPFNAGINFSQTYDMSTKQWSNGWGVSAGIGVGTDAAGIGLNVGYGSSGWTYGIGGYYNSKAWDDNPVYAPGEWNDNEDVLNNNNCYSYAIDDPDNPFGGKPQPGQYSGDIFDNLTLNDVTNAAIRDGYVKKPNFFNKMGFGKRGYYSVYLVMDNVDGVQDYHWYRQDKGGLWSQKHGSSYVTNVDGSGRLIRNPARANHNYGTYPGYGTLNYSSGGIFLWVRRR